MSETNNDFVNPNDSVACPSCGAALSATAVLCINCGTEVTPGTGAIELSPQLPSSSPPMPRPSQGFGNTDSMVDDDTADHTYDRWSGTVSMGIRLVLIGTLLIMVSLASMVFATQMESAMLAAMLLVSIVVGAILNLVGPLLCLAVPSESGAKGYIIGSVLLTAVQVSLNFVEVDFDKVAYVKMFSALCSMLSFILFILFVKQIGTYIVNSDVVAKAGSTLMIAVVMAGIVVVFIGLTFAMAKGGDPGGLGAIACMGIAIFLVVGLIFLVQYLNLLVAAANALTNPR